MPSKLAGILNLTPDSFSDGGQHADIKSALAAAQRMAGEGAAIIDIGAESTRPGAGPLTPEEEWHRLQHFLPEFARLNINWSIDTRHAETARKATALGASWLNDVSGFTAPAMLEVAKASSCKLIVMHSLGVPSDKSRHLPESCDPIKEIMHFAHTHMGYMQQQGIAKDRILFDPGIGFGKTTAQNWQIIDRIAEFKALGVPLYVGHSRKSFLAQRHPDREIGTLIVSKHLIASGVDYLRVHDVAAHRELL